MSFYEPDPLTAAECEEMADTIVGIQCDLDPLDALLDTMTEQAEYADARRSNEPFSGYPDMDEVRHFGAVAKEQCTDLRHTLTELASVLRDAAERYGDDGWNDDTWEDYASPAERTAHDARTMAAQLLILAARLDAPPPPPVSGFGFGTGTAFGDGQQAGGFSAKPVGGFGGQP